MKKRVKLLTTIASLCLAVALMAFGVYAASTATFTVKSTAKFDVTGDLVGTITVTAYNSADGTTTGDQAGQTTQVVNYTTTSGEIDLSTSVITLSLDKPYVYYEVSYANDGSTPEATIKLSNFSATLEGATGTWGDAACIDGDSSTDTKATLSAKYTPAATTTAAETYAVTFTISLAKKG